MGTNAEVLDLAMSRLGQRTSLRVRADVLAEINNSIQELETDPFIPWFLSQAEVLNINIDDTSVALNENFLREVEDTRPYYVLEGTVHHLTKRLYGMIDVQTPSTLALYSIEGTTFHFRKAADIAYTINVLTYRKSNDPIVDNNSEVSNPWLLNAKDYVLYNALKTVAALHVQNEKIDVKFAQLEAKAYKKLYDFHESRIHVNQDYFVGGSTDGS